MADIDQECGAAAEEQPLLVSTPPKSRFLRFFIVALAIGVTGTLALTKLLHPGTNKVARLPNIANPLATMLPDEVETYCASLNKENCVRFGFGYCQWGSKLQLTPACVFKGIVDP